MNQMARILSEINSRPLIAPDFAGDSFLHRKKKSKKARTSRSTNRGAGTAKGSNNEIAVSGTSYKSRKQQAKRAAIRAGKQKH